MFAPLVIGADSGSSVEVSGRRGPTLRKREAAYVEDAAEEEAREDRDALRVAGS